MSAILSKKFSIINISRNRRLLLRYDPKGLNSNYFTKPMKSKTTTATKTRGSYIHTWICISAEYETANTVPDNSFNKLSFKVKSRNASRNEKTSKISKSCGVLVLELLFSIINLTLKRNLKIYYFIIWLYSHFITRWKTVKTVFHL